MGHSVMEALHQVIGWVALGIELLAVAVIVAAVLMLFVVVRTFLSWALKVEIGGR